MQGAIAIGNHADIVVWEPEVEFDLNDDHPIYIKHPVSVNHAFFTLIIGLSLYNKLRDPI